MHVKKMQVLNANILLLAFVTKQFSKEKVHFYFLRIGFLFFVTSIFVFTQNIKLQIFHSLKIFNK